VTRTSDLVSEYVNIKQITINTRSQTDKYKGQKMPTDEVNLFFVPPPGQTVRRKHYVLGLFFRPSVRSFVNSLINTTF